MKTKRQLGQEIDEFLRGSSRRRSSHARMGRRSSHARMGRHVAHHGQHWKGSEIQSLLFDKQWTVPEAKRWAHEHGYKSVKVHVSDDYIRLRQFEPVPNTEKRTITLGQGIKAIIEQVK